MEVDKIVNWMTIFNEKVQAEKNYLSELDTPIGDGDHGGNMSRGMKAVTEALNEKTPEDVQGVFKVIAMQLINKVGGASGLLYGSAFLAIAKEYNENLPANEWLQIGLDSIQKRGKAEVGEKTMVDVWNALIPEVANGSISTASVDKSILINKDIKATKGRASYVGDRSIGHIDPGSYSSGLLFQSLIEAEVI